MDQTTAIETAATTIAAQVCRDFEPEVAEWAARSLRDVILPHTFAGWQQPDDSAVREVIADGIWQFEAPDPDERYSRLAIAYVAALLAPTTSAAYQLARRCMDAPPAPNEAAELIDEINVVLETIDAEANPALYGEFADDIEQAIADCLFATGDREVPSRRIQVELMHRADERVETTRVEPPDPAIDHMAAEARASLAVSWEAARFATEGELHHRDQVLGVRDVYDHALDMLAQMQQRFGASAVRRVTHDQTRTDLIEVLADPITPDDWNADLTLRGILFTRLSRDV